jgi:hypothetical protein
VLLFAALNIPLYQRILLRFGYYFFMGINASLVFGGNSNLAGMSGLYLYQGDMATFNKITNYFLLTPFTALMSGIFNSLYFREISFYSGDDDISTFSNNCILKQTYAAIAQFFILHLIL